MPIPYFASDLTVPLGALDLLVCLAGLLVLVAVGYTWGYTRGRDKQGDYLRFLETGAQELVVTAREKCHAEKVEMMARLDRQREAMEEAQREHKDALMHLFNLRQQRDEAAAGRVAAEAEVAQLKKIHAGTPHPGPRWKETPSGILVCPRCWARNAEHTEGPRWFGGGKVCNYCGEFRP